MSERDASGDRVSRRINVESPASTRRNHGERDTASPPAPHPAETDLETLDQALADHADELLDGAFESVEDVLSRSELDDAAGKGDRSEVEESLRDDGESIKADDVPEGDDERQQSNEADTGDAVQSNAADDGQDGDDGEQSEDDGSVSEFEMIPSRDSTVKAGTTALLQNETDEAEQDDATTSGADHDAAAMTTGAPESPEGESADVNSDEGFSDSPADENQQSECPADTDEPRAASAKDDCESSRNRKATGTSDRDSASFPAAASRDAAARTIQHGMAGIISALVLLSAPLNLLPTSLRPLVDWLALSLIFWVPIVWVLVLLLA